MGGRDLLRSLAVLAVLAGLAAAGSAAGDPGEEKAHVDARVERLRDELAGAQAREGVLTSELSAITAKARAAQAEVDEAEARLGALEAELAQQRARLAELDETIRLQTERIAFLEGQHEIALDRLEHRVRELYMTDSPDTLSFLVGADSFGELLENLDFLRRIGEQDERIVRRVEEIRVEVEKAREETRRAREEAKETERVIAERTEEQRLVTERLQAGRDALVAAEQERRAALDEILQVERTLEHEVEVGEAESAALAEQIRIAQQRAASAQAASASTPRPVSDGPLAWPVGGPVTSGFGPRWGRMHEGIDIAVPEGTPVGAAAAGVVIYAGWLGGYGNLVVVDHGNGLSTAYAHNSGYAVSVGQSVTTGQTLAYSGNTGNSSGPHVHFEVRVGGSATDPLGYL
jgi:murein DD-endopeptidase MepM/ murein hydrolase activator NlpD